MYVVVDLHEDLVILTQSTEQIERSCADAVAEAITPRKRYVPLPHVLLCLDLTTIITTLDQMGQVYRWRNFVILRFLSHARRDVLGDYVRFGLCFELL